MGKQKKNELSIKNWVSKSNTLNEIRDSHMTICQMRLFTIYLSKINPKNINSREVTFKLDEYTKIMQFKQTNITRLKESANDLLKVIITFWEEQKKGEKLREFTSCQLFKKVKLSKNEENEWIISINCHDDVLPLMFELKQYLKYELWNILQLSSNNQQRIYELLKQYEKVGTREINVKDLRDFLGIKPNEYPEWADFRKRILEPSEKALEKSTDIKFTWEAVRGGGKGGKIQAVKFNIEKNDLYIRQYTFDEYIAEQNKSDITDNIEEFERSNDIISFLSEARNNELENSWDNRMAFFSEALQNEFTIDQVELIYKLALTFVDKSRHKYNLDTSMYDYLSVKFAELNSKKDIKYRYNYLKKLIELDVIEC